MKTLKDFTIYGYPDKKTEPCSCSNDTERIDEWHEKNICIKSSIDLEDLKQAARDWIKEVQNGKVPSRDIIPENMRGSIAKDMWNDSRFTLGIEYGCILAMLYFFNLEESE